LRIFQQFLTSKKDKVEFHPYPLPKERTIKIVTKGLPTNLSNEELPEELLAICFEQNPLELFQKGKKGSPYT